VIRRGFWLTAGAVAGIYGYRRASAVARRLAVTLNPGTGSLAAPGLAPAAGVGATAKLAPAARVTGRRARRGALALARQTYRFSCDVREGMELYRLEHSAPARPAAGNEPIAREEDPGTGPTLSTTDHDTLPAAAHPEDGH
jgi:hypothetical protein